MPVISTHIVGINYLNKDIFMEAYALSRFIYNKKV